MGCYPLSHMTWPGREGRERVAGGLFHSHSLSLTTFTFKVRSGDPTLSHQAQVEGDCCPRPAGLL